MPPKIESQPIVLSDTSFESFSSISEQTSSVSLARNDNGRLYGLPDTRTTTDKQTALLDSLKQSLLDHYTAEGSRPAQTYAHKQHAVANKHIENIIDSVIKGYQNKATSGKNIHEIMGKVDTYVKSLAFSTKQFKDAAKEAAAAKSSVYVRLNTQTKAVELHTRSFTGRISHSIAKFFGSSAAKEQDSMTREILKAAILTREEARAITQNTKIPISLTREEARAMQQSIKATVSQEDIASAVRLLPEGDVLQGSAITAVFKQLKENRIESPGQVYMQGAKQLLDKNLTVKAAMDEVWASNSAYCQTSRSAQRSIARSTVNQGLCLTELAQELSKAGLAENLVKGDFLTTKQGQIPRLKSPAEFLLHCLGQQGFEVNAQDAEALTARYMDRESGKFDFPVPTSLVGFADKDPKEYTESTLLKDINDALRAYIDGVGYRFGEFASGNSPVDTSIRQVIENHRLPDTRELFQVLTDQAQLFKARGSNPDDRFANTIRLHSDGKLPTADDVKTFLAGVRKEYPNDPALCERKTIEKFCPTLAKQINEAEKTATEKVQVEQKRLEAEQAQKQSEAEKQAQEARARQEAIAQHNEQIVTDELAKKVTASVETSTDKTGKSLYMATPEDRARFIKQHFTPDAEGRLHLNAPGKKPASAENGVETGRITDVFAQHHIALDDELTSEHPNDSLSDRLNDSINKAIDLEVARGKTYGEAYDAMHENFANLVLNLHKEFTTDTVRATRTTMFSHLLEHLNSPELLLATKPADAAKLARMTIEVFKSPISLKHVSRALETAVQAGSSFENLSRHLHELSRDLKNLSCESVDFARSYLGSVIESRYGDKLTLTELKYLTTAAGRALDAFSSEQKLSIQKYEDVKKPLQDFQMTLFERLDDAVAMAPYSDTSEEGAPKMETVVFTVQDELYKKIDRNGDGNKWLELIGGPDWKQKIDAHAQSLVPQLRQSYFHNVGMVTAQGSSLQELKELTRDTFAKMHSQVQDLMPKLLSIRPYTAAEGLPKEVAAGYLKAEAALFDTFSLTMDQNAIESLNKVIASAMYSHVTMGTFSRDFADFGISNEEGTIAMSQGIAELSRERKTAMSQGITKLSMGQDLFSPEAIHNQMRREIIHTSIRKLKAFQTGKAALGNEMDRPLEGLGRCFGRALMTDLVKNGQMENVVKAVFDGYQAILKASTEGNFLRSAPAAKLFKEQKSFSGLEKAIEKLVEAGSAPLRAVEEKKLGFKLPKNTIPDAVSVMCHMLSTHLKNIDAATTAETPRLWQGLKNNCMTLATSAMVDSYKKGFDPSKAVTHDERVVARCHVAVMDWISDIHSGKI